MKIQKGGIGIFDSGIGGLTVLAECRKLLPEERFYYYGDNQHAPYGNLPIEKIRRYVFSAFEKFQRLEVKAAVLACNTVTALCVEELRERYSFPIIGAEPAVFTAARRGGEVWVLTTRATYNSERFRTLCKRAEEKYPQGKIRAVACDCLAGVIETNIGKEDFNYTLALPSGTPSSVVLGCTHYIYIKESIRQFYGCEVYDGNSGIAKRLADTLLKEGKNGCDFVEKTTFMKKVGMNDHSVTTTPKNTNKCLPHNQETFERKREGKKLVFLGKLKGKNEKIYKQTFGF